MPITREQAYALKHASREIDGRTELCTVEDFARAIGEPRVAAGLRIQIDVTTRHDEGRSAAVFTL